ncbi:putative 4-hydroxy-4-methyl-2-oxoglutarate aldolase [Gayadomonas joobiniege]|uniref:putative 4-hydroxy-4-methyl-2-oxoglutarate aldolase n=1 Tax=Gayadomonas joobiniege TaxID=1234606 RepID=UPI00036FEA8F|nr:putative 4-hydroxy-4-methyl-2-oxoglutarate aldolase [Gayadomonas joobiniege]
MQKLSFSTPDLYDLHRDKITAMPAGLHHFGAIKHFYGQVVTVSCPNDNSQAVAMLKQAGQGKVLLIDGFGDLKHAYLGDNMALEALKNGWQGVVVNACVRDIEILRTLDLPVMALGHTPASTVKRGLGQVNQAVELLEQTITPADWLYADENGIIISQTALNI